MSDGHPTQPQREALRLICAAEPMSTTELAADLVDARPDSTNPGYRRAISRMAGALVWRLHAQHLMSEASPEIWSTTRAGRELIGCTRT
uniref:hypothetical protein n=1 Tax=Herbidospora sakaeratensis TaxID=564415 RepID=UPI000781087E|nr:hypothetical protein [Herbidospora sakaeratensis]